MNRLRIVHTEPTKHPNWPKHLRLGPGPFIQTPERKEVFFIINAEETKEHFSLCRG